MPTTTRPADSAAVRRLAAELAGLRRRLGAVENAPQLAHSSLEVGGQPVTIPDMVNDAREAVATSREVEQTLAAARAELEQAQAELAARLGTAETDLTAAEARLDDAEAQVSQAITVAGQADAAAQAAGAAAASAQTAADAATSGALAAQTTADAAATAAADAAGIAAGKGKVVFGSAAPAAADRLATTLWIDTTSGANTPKRWSGSAWVAVTDKAAVDAANAAAAAQDDATNAIAAAAAAQLKADQAHTLAGTAEQHAQAAIDAASGAQATADARPRMLFSTNAPSGTAPQGSVWFRVNASGQVIGQWQQTAASNTGSTWTVREIRSEVIANLDVGKLTAGTAVVVDLVAQKIAAATAAFQTVDVANLFVTGTSTVATQVAQKIWAAKIVAQKILATEVLIGGPGANLLPDAAVTTQAAYTRSAGVVQNPTGGRSGAGAFVVTSTAATQDWSTAATVVDGARPYLVPAQGGRQYVIEAAVRSSVAVAAASTSLQLVRYFYDAAGTLLGSGTLNFDVAIPAGAWTTVRATTPAAPPNTAYVRVGGRVNASLAAGAVVEWSDPACYLAVDSALVVDGAITAGKLAAQIVLATTIIAGDPNGTHAEMSPSGFRVFRLNEAEGAAEEVIRLGTDTNDYFGVVDTNGDLLASISSDGLVSATSVSSRDDLTVAGLPLLGELVNFESPSLEGSGSWLDRLPRGIVGFGQTGSGHSTTADVTHGIYEVSFLAQPGRSYRITVPSFMMSANGAGTVGMVVAYTIPSTDGGIAATPKTTSQKIGWSYVRTTGSGLVSIPTLTRVMRCHPQGPTFAGELRQGVCRVLLCLYSTGTTASLYGNADTRTQIVVEDIGPHLPQTEVANNGDPVTPNPDPPSKVTRTQTFTAAWVQSYKGDNSRYSSGGGDNRMYQGQQPYTGFGNMRSLAGFQSLSSLLSGAEVNWIDVYFYFEHWYNNAGGTAVAGVHGHGSEPSTFSHSVYWVNSSPNWPKPGGRWFRLPRSVYAGFKSGSYRGVSLLAPGGDYQYYGYARSDVKLMVNYTK